ncbi:hypothetical protein RI129_008395 [Pyrocoelia pectoralis]|uniref:Uncharacterized protein n=1 Tax=Pyrocoelia pectoralis TaxID=417401 RepID=A0AAN7VB55_9COLE
MIPIYINSSVSKPHHLSTPIHQTNITMSKLVILFALVCAVFGVEIPTEVKPVEFGIKTPVSASSVVTPYSGYPYGIHGFSGYHPYQHGFTGETHNPEIARSAHPSGAYSYQYHYSAPFQPSQFTDEHFQKSVVGLPQPVGTPHSALHGVHQFGFPNQFGYPAFPNFGRSYIQK